MAPETDERFREASSVKVRVRLLHGRRQGPELWYHGAVVWRIQPVDRFEAMLEEVKQRHASAYGEDLHAFALSNIQRRLGWVLTLEELREKLGVASPAGAGAR